MFASTRRPIWKTVVFKSKRGMLIRWGVGIGFASRMLLVVDRSSRAFIRSYMDRSVVNGVRVSSQSASCRAGEEPWQRETSLVESRRG